MGILFTRLSFVYSWLKIGDGYLFKLADEGVNRVDRLPQLGRHIRGGVQGSSRPEIPPLSW
jgi:hypothetical protein